MIIKCCKCEVTCGNSAEKKKEREGERAHTDGRGAPDRAVNRKKSKAKQ